MASPGLVVVKLISSFVLVNIDIGLKAVSFQQEWPRLTPTVNGTDKLGRILNGQLTSGANLGGVLQAVDCVDEGTTFVGQALAAEAEEVATLAFAVETAHFVQVLKITFQDPYATAFYRQPSFFRQVLGSVPHTF